MSHRYVIVVEGPSWWGTRLDFFYSSTTEKELALQEWIQSVSDTVTPLFIGRVPQTAAEDDIRLSKVYPVKPAKRYTTEAF